MEMIQRQRANFLFALPTDQLLICFHDKQSTSIISVGKIQHLAVNACPTTYVQENPFLEKSDNQSLIFKVVNLSPKYFFLQVKSFFD